MIKWLPRGPLGSPSRETPSDWGSCPSCGTESRNRGILTATLPESGAPVTLVACLACGAHYFKGLAVGDYSHEPPEAEASLAFYLQQGANMGGMARRLAAIDRPPGTRYLEIGCGFGLGVDIARRALGWDVVGVDPSPFGAVGRELLGLPIEARYLDDNSLPSEPFDVVHASEFLEHVPNPLAVLRTLRLALKPEGSLILTTPAAEMIRPDTSEGLLVPLLSLGWHLIIQTAGSLTLLLQRAGFTDVEVMREGAQLVAHAGRRHQHLQADRQVYRSWLRSVGSVVPDVSDLGLGVRARLFRELAGAGEVTAAGAAWTDLDAAVQTRFSRGLESWCATGTDDRPGLPLDALARQEPLCLAGVLLFRGLQRMNQGQNAEPFLNGAVQAARRLRAALHKVGADDGDAEDVTFAAERELIIYAADRGETGVADRIAALEAGAGPARFPDLRRRCFLPLVNHGALADARQLIDVMRGPLGAAERMELMSHEDASILYCASTLELQTPDGQVNEAIAWLRSLRRSIVQSFLAGIPESAGALFWPAVEAEALGLRRLERDDEAAALASRIEAQMASLQGFPMRKVK